MKERIENKIDEIVLYILKKDIKEISMDDFNILMNKLIDIRSKENVQESKKRMAELAMSTFGGF